MTSETYYMANMQYANLRLDTQEHQGLELNSENIKVGSILIYQTERELLTEQDFPEYSNFEFLSDIGGTAGLILGLSAASIISIGEVIISIVRHKIMRRWYSSSTSVSIKTDCDDLSDYLIINKWSSAQLL